MLTCQNTSHYRPVMSKYLPRNNISQDYSFFPVDEVCITRLTNHYDNQDPWI